MAANVNFLEGKNKIRVIRKQLRLTQGDFQDEHFTRGYLGLMENGKRNITYHASSYIASRLMEIAKEQGINLSIEDDYFFRPVETDAEKYCTQKLMEPLSISEVEEIFKIGETYSLNFIMAKALRVQGDIFFNNGKYREGYKKYFNSLELLNINTDYSETNYVLYQIGLCKYYLRQYDEALVYLEKVLEHHCVEKEIYGGAIINSALCYKNLDNVNKAIELVDKFILLCNKEENILNYIDALTIKANCHEKNNDIEVAIEINKSLVKLIEDNKNENTIKKLGMIYNNLGSLERRKEHLSQALEYYNKSQNIRNSIDNENVSHTLIEKADVYIDKHLYEEAIMIVNLGIEKAREFNDTEYLFNGYKKLENIYETLGYNDELQEVILSIVELLRENDDKLLKIQYYLKLQGICFNNKNYEDAYKCYKSIKKVLH